ncbi:MAG: PD-(D/E)XK nuclease family protein [Caldisericum sp.]
MEKFLLQRRVYELSVSDVLMLSKCEKALELKLKGYKVNFKFEKLSYTGMLLHKTLNYFAKSTSEGLFDEIDLNNKNVETYIKNKIYEVFFREVNKDNRSTLDIVWKYLEDFSVLLSTIVEENNISLKDLFIYSEKPFKFKLTDQTFIRGRFDVLLRIGNKIKIIDYKTGKDDFERDTFQISLYYKAVKDTLGIEADPHIMYFEDGKIITESYTKSEIEMTLEVIKNLINTFLNKFEQGKIELSTNRKFCKFCSMRNYSFCKFT